MGAYDSCWQFISKPQPKEKIMPNWCNNKLTVFGPDEDVQRFKKNAIGNSPWHTEQEKKNVLNFHSLTPVPPEVVSAGYDQAGYEWELMNWGCKWGACSTELVEEREGHLTYFFDTAWSPPIPFLSKLAPQWSTLTFLLDYEEMGMGFKGITKVHGDAVEDHCLDLCNPLPSQLKKVEVIDHVIN
jgi:hypothetical protein